MEGEDMKGNTQDLTKGSIVKAIILFSVPLLIGNLFQQLYNAVDSYVVGFREGCSCCGWGKYTYY